MQQVRTCAFYYAIRFGLLKFLSHIPLGSSILSTTEPVRHPLRDQYKNGYCSLENPSLEKWSEKIWDFLLLRIRMDRSRLGEQKP